MNSKHYDSDLTDGEFAILEPLLPARKARGRPRSVALREILDAIFYVLGSGVPWRMLPDGFPPWKTAFQRVDCYVLRGETRLSAHYDLRPGTPNCRGSDRAIGAPPSGCVPELKRWELIHARRKSPLTA